jgi:hypothetical protein
LPCSLCFRRHKGYSFINVAGLAVGVACCLVIVLFVQHERSFDAFHAEERMMGVLGFFSALAIGIACLGLLGFAAFAAEQRSK